MSATAIILENVTVELGGHPVLENLNGEFAPGCLTAILGPNGAGKTTLLHAILGLVPYKGHIYFGPDHRENRPRLGYVPQRLDLDRGSPITVRDFLAAVQTNRPLWTGISPESNQRSHALLEKIGIDAILDRPIGKISGGETQRMLLAQSLLRQPEILLLDEPVAAVDIAGEALFCDVLEEVQNELGITTLLVSHDLSIVSTHARNVVCLNRHIICSGPVSAVMTADNLRKVFGPHSDVFNHSHSHSFPPS